MSRPRQKQSSRLSQAIAGLRESIGLTQQQLADRLGVSLAAIAMAETSRTPTPQMIAQVHRIVLDTGRPAPGEPSVLTDQQRDLDDILYRHLVDQNEIYRVALADAIEQEVTHATSVIVAAAVSQQSCQPTLDGTQTAQVFGYLRHLSELADLLRPDMDNAAGLTPEGIAEIEEHGREIDAFLAHRQRNP